MKRVLHAVVNYIKDTDKFMWLYCLGLSGLSVLLLYSVYVNGFVNSPRIVIIQAAAIGIGVVAAIILSKIDYRLMASLWKIYVPVTVGLVLLTFTPLGISRDGADDKAWISLGIVDLQPSELLKLAFVFTFAMHLAKVKEDINRLKNFLLLCVHGMIPTLLIVAQGDFGSALVFVCIMVFMLFAAGLSWKYVAAGIGAALVAAPLVYFFVFQEVHRQRLRILFNPELDPMGIGFQQLQGRNALGAGMLFGRGLFSNNLINIPELYNDFIFAYIGQTLGFVGCVAVTLVLALLCVKILMTGRMSKEPMGCYICVGIFAILIFQAVINIGMVLSVLPVIGVTLPFLSYGGTSVVTMYVSMGIVLSVYMHNKRKGMFDD